MANYKQSSIVVESWTRAYQVIINNQYGTIPSITFNEESIIDTGNGTISKPIGHITEPFSDTSVTFDLLNPATGEVIGNTSYLNAYILLASLYQALANKRDAAQPA